MSTLYFFIKNTSVMLQKNNNHLSICVYGLVCQILSAFLLHVCCARCGLQMKIQNKWNICSQSAPCSA